MLFSAQWKLTLSGLFILTTLAACGGGSKEPAVDGDVSLNSDTLIFNGLTYRNVISPYTGKTWLDRNIGASEVCTALDDSACYGDYYQWGRNADGHEKTTSNTTTVQATDIANVGHGDFIVPDYSTSSGGSNVIGGYTGGGLFPSDPNDNDWAKSADTDGAQRHLQWMNIQGESVCPSGYRVPSADELAAETSEAFLAASDAASAFASFLKLPAAGMRHSIYPSSDTEMSSQGEFAYLWSNTNSSDDASKSEYIAFGNENNPGAVIAATTRETGIPIRCISTRPLEHIYPIADAGKNRTANTGSDVTLDASASYNPASDALSYHWTLESRPTGSAATLSSSNTASPTFNADVDGVYQIKLTLNEGSEHATSASVTIEARTVTINFNGASYAIVVSPYTGRVWLDRNLGASAFCGRFDDAACYGDYYQWGRKSDGHQKPDSATTPDQSPFALVVPHGKFITATIDNQFDWAHDVDADGSLRATAWPAMDAGNICPSGFRVPSYEELKLETIDSADGMLNRSDAFDNFLRLPSAGMRQTDGAMNGQGEYGGLWSANVSYYAGESLGIGYNERDSSAYNFFMPTRRASGFPVRCIRDENAVVDSTAPTAVPSLLNGNGQPVSDGIVEFGTNFYLSAQGSTDIGGSVVKYHWQALSSAAQVGLFSGGVEVTRNQPSLLVAASSTPVPVGAQNYQLVVEDGSGNRSAAVELQLMVKDTVAPSAMLAVFDSNGQSITQIDQGQTFTLSGQHSSDANGGVIAQYHWRAVNSEAQVGDFASAAEVVTSSNSLTITDVLPAGLQSWQLIVEDQSGNLSAPIEISVIIVAADLEAPTAQLSLVDSNGQAIGNGVVEFGTDFYLSAQGSSDAGGGSIASYRWQALTSDAQVGQFSAGAEVNGSQSNLLVDASVTPVAAGAHRYQLVVVDDSGNASDPVEVQVTVQDSVAPTAIIGFLNASGQAVSQIDQGQDFILSGQGSSDANGGSIAHYHWTAVSTAAQVGVFTGGQEVVTDANTLTVTDDVPAGAQTWRLQVEDASGNLSAAADIQVIINAVADISISPASPRVLLGDSLILSAAVSGLTDDSLSWSVNGVDGGNATLGAVDSAGVYSAPAVMPGNGAMTLTATSVADASVSDSVTLQLVDPHSAGLYAAYSTGHNYLEAPIVNGYDSNCSSTGDNVYQAQCTALTSSPVDWAWGNFNVTWTGFLHAPVSGSYGISSQIWVDGAVYVEIDGQVIADFDTTGGGYSGSVDLVAGERVPVTLRFTANGGSNNMSLFWTLPGQSAAAIPRAYLEPDQIPASSACVDPCGHGALAGATMNIFKLESNGDKTLLFSETTSGGDLSTAGLFDAHVAFLQDDSWYLYELSGGEDVDADRDGVLDTVATPNLGSWHLFAKGSDLKAQSQIHVSMASDIVYHKFDCQLHSAPDALTTASVNKTIANVLAQDVNNDASIDMADILNFDAVTQSGKLSPVYQRKQAEILSAIRADDRFYFSGGLDYVGKLGFVPVNMAFSPDSSLAYVIHGNNLEIIDISNAQAMSVLSTLDVTGAKDLTVSNDGNTLYLVGDNGLQRVDVSSSSAPVITDDNSIGLGNLTSVALAHSGDVLFVVSDASGHLDTIDLTASTLSVSGTLSLPAAGVFRNLLASADDSRLFVASNTLYVIDVSNIAVPSTLASRTYSSNDLRKLALSADESTAYIARAHLLDVVNVADADNGNITVLSTHDMTYDFYYPGSVAVHGDTLYAMNVGRGILVYDISTPTQLLQIDSSISFSINYGPMELTPDGSLLFAGDFKAFDAGDPSGNPITGRYIRASQVDAVAISADNSRAYVLDNHVGKLQIIDISNSRDMTLDSVVGELSGISGGQIVLNAAGDRAFVAAGDSGVKIVNIADPTALSVVSTYDSDGSVNAVDLDESRNRLYLADGLSGVKILDISDETTPVLLGSQNTSGDARDVVVDGNTLYLAARESGVQVIDISDETAPSLTTTFNTDSKTYYARALALSADGSKLFVGGGGTSAPSGFSILDVSTPATPVSLAAIQTDDARDIVLSADETRAYIADGGSSSGNLKVIDISNPAQAHVVGGIIHQSYAHAGLRLALSSDDRKVYLADGQGDLMVIEVCE